MRHGTGTAQFDTTDVDDSPPIDRIDDVLTIAASVLEDYGPDPGATRIERMARWLLLNVGSLPLCERAGAISRFRVEKLHVVRVGDKVGITVPASSWSNATHVPHEQARELAVALLRAVEQAES